MRKEESMKNFQNYTPEKYARPEYVQVEEGIYRTKDPYGIVSKEIYVTSLTFEQEKECYGEEEGCPQYISQVPFENLLDKYSLFVTDFYESLNEKSDTVCYQEFGSKEIENIRRLRAIIGGRVYAEPFEEDGEEYYKLVIE